LQRQHQSVQQREAHLNRYLAPFASHPEPHLQDSGADGSMSMSMSMYSDGADDGDGDGYDHGDGIGDGQK